MNTSDNTAESRARLLHLPRTKSEQEAHDFRNLVNDLVFAVELRDTGLVRFYADELQARYLAKRCPKR